MEICTVGGYAEIGKNMTAIKVGDEVVIIDMGIFLPPLINLQEEDRKKTLSLSELYRIGAVPDDTVIKDWQKKVKAIVLGHCHLDHIGAIPYLASKYKCPVIGSPYTIQVLRAILDDNKKTIPNVLKPVTQNSKIKISKNFTLELINVTHSTLQASITTLHTPDGVIMYTPDYKFDNHPTLGKKTNMARLRELGKKGVKVVITESLYADREMKTPSEKVAKELLKDVMLSVDNKNKAVFVTTFASHIARIKSVIEFAERQKRKVIILGRSMGKYIKAAEDLKLVDFSKRAHIATYKKQIGAQLEKIKKNPGKYIVICTGNQAEPGSVLDRIVNKEYKFRFDDSDIVIFSCKTIPASINIANRELLESKLKQQRVRIFKEIHVSGHASREDHRDFINMTKPEIIIPAHGDHKKEAALAHLAAEMGYKIGQNVFLVSDGQTIKI